MRLLDRYLFREMLTPLAFCLVAIQSFIIFFTVFLDAEKIQESKLHLWETLEYAAASSMEYVPIVLPVSLLLALLRALTNHARHNEITAIRTSGIAFWRFCTPYFFVGICVSAILFALNETVVPRCANWSSRILNRYTHASVSAGAQNLYPNRSFSNEREHRDWIIGLYCTSPVKMFRAQVAYSLPDGSLRRLYAERAMRVDGVWTFINVREYAQASAEAPLVPFLQTSILAMPEFDETPREFRSEIVVSDYLAAGGVHTANIPFKDILDYLRWHPDLSPLDKGRLLTQMHERLSAALTCIVVVFIAIPFGVVPGRRSLFVGVAGGLFICFAFFILQRLSLAYGSSGEWPAWLAAWLPNLLFASTGLILTARLR